MEVRQKVSVATRLKLRQVFSGAAAALVIVFGISIFLSDNLGNTQKAKAGSVTLGNFSAAFNGHAAEIKWTTTSESDNAFFALERSSNNSDYEVITEIEGGGTRNTTYSYSFTDTHPLRGVSYYRLKQVNTDQTFSYLGIQSLNNEFTGEDTPPPTPPQPNEYFETVSITAIAPQSLLPTGTPKVENEAGESLSIFPVPAVTELNADLFVNYDMDNHIDIVDLKGKLVYSQFVMLSKGLNHIKIPVTDISSGVYFIRLQGEGDKPLVQKFIRQ